MSTLNAFLSQLTKQLYRFEHRADKQLTQQQTRRQDEKPTGKTKQLPANTQQPPATTQQPPTPNEDTPSFVNGWRMDNISVMEKADALLRQGLSRAKVDKVIDDLLRNMTTAAKTRVATYKPTLQAWMKLRRSHG